MIIFDAHTESAIEMTHSEAYLHLLNEIKSNHLKYFELEEIAKSLEVENDEFISIEHSIPDDQNDIYWVRGGKIGDRPYLVRFNDYKSIGGFKDYWQDLYHNDLSLEGTEWKKIKKNELEPENFFL